MRTLSRLPKLLRIRLRSVKLADGREFPCDLALLAIGQGAMGSLALQFPGVETDAKGRVQAEEKSGRTGNPKLWVGGDATGGELVVTAVQDGKRAARSGRNPRTGATIKIKAARVPKFRAGKALKDAVN